MIRRLALAIALLPAIGSAQPPAGMQIDPAVHAWFESLVRADGFRCCSESDCAPAVRGELTESGGNYTVWEEGQPFAIPETKIVRRDDNPLQKTIICKVRTAVFCVIPYSGL